VSAARVIPWVLHEFIEYIAGVFLIVAPFLFFGSVADVVDTPAFPLFVGVGVAVVAAQLLTRGKAGIAELLPIRVHATLDYLVALFLVISPFLFGLTDADDPAALLIPMLLGVAHLVITLLTRFPLEQAQATAAASSEQVASDASASSTPASPSNTGPGSASSGDVASDDAASKRSPGRSEPPA
jgi:hypothetical protein